MATKKTSAKKAEPTGLTLIAIPKKKPAVQLRKPQLRILAALAKAKEPLDRKAIAAKSKTDLAWIGNYCGSANAETRKRNDRDFPSLLTLGYAKVSDDGTYQITPAGRKALEKE